jgi:SAM-dependent methyltransferase
MTADNEILRERVREFYETHPYPPPVEELDRYRERWNDPLRRRTDFHLFWPARKYRDDFRILVAGCGTSQAAKHAMRWPSARITAIDFSANSVQHTEQLKVKYGLSNLEVRQLAVESVGELGQQFDQIVCTGVLHHLPDPDAGLRALRGVLNPDGAVHLMVYAPYGRAGVYMLQDYCRRLGVRPTSQDIRDLATSLSALPRNHPLVPLRDAPDFASEAALADALLHPQDRAYSVPQLFSILSDSGLRFGRWVRQAPYLPLCGAIARVPHAARRTDCPVARSGAIRCHRVVARHHGSSQRDRVS